ncbi:MAG: hypothetical protein ABIO70_28930 [Pseudomonadota bacterium]
MYRNLITFYDVLGKGRIESKLNVVPAAEGTWVLVYAPLDRSATKKLRELKGGAAHAVTAFARKVVRTEGGLVIALNQEGVAVQWSTGGSQWAPPQKLLRLEPGGKATPETFAPRGNDTDKWVSSNHRIRSGDHLIIPVDSHSSEMLESLPVVLDGFHPDLYGHILRSLRQPSLDARVLLIEAELRERGLPGAAADTQRGAVQTRLKDPLYAIQDFFSSVHKGCLIGIGVVFLIMAVLVVILMAATAKTTVWSLFERAPTTPEMSTVEAHDAPSVPEVAASSAATQPPPASPDLETAMRGLFRALEESKNGAMKNVYDTQLALYWTRHGGDGIAPLKDPDRIAWGLLTALWETKDPNFATGEHLCKMYEAKKPALSRETWEKYEEHPTAEAPARLGPPERDMVAWWFCQSTGKPALPHVSATNNERPIASAETCEALVPTHQHEIIQAIDEMTARVKAAGESSPPECP